MCDAKCMTPSHILNFYIKYKYSRVFVHKHNYHKYYDFILFNIKQLFFIENKQCPKLHFMCISYLS